MATSLCFAASMDPTRFLTHIEAPTSDLTGPSPSASASTDVPQKTCTVCHATKPETEFGQKRGKRAAHCLECNRAKLKAHYQANKQAYVDKAAVHNLKYRQRNVQLVEQALEGQSCSRCGTAQDLTFYQGPDTPHQPVHMAKHAAVSVQAVLDALGRSVIVCRTCLGEHFISGTNPWQSMTSEERKRFKAQRQEEGHTPTPRDYFKRYRPVGG